MMARADLRFTIAADTKTAAALVAFVPPTAASAAAASAAAVALPDAAAAGAALDAAWRAHPDGDLFVFHDGRKRIGLAYKGGEAAAHAVAFTGSGRATSHTSRLLAPRAWLAACLQEAPLAAGHPLALCVLHDGRAPVLGLGAAPAPAPPPPPSPAPAAAVAPPPPPAFAAAEAAAPPSPSPALLALAPPPAPPPAAAVAAAAAAAVPAAVAAAVPAAPFPTLERWALSSSKGLRKANPFSAAGVVEGVGPAPAALTSLYGRWPAQVDAAAFRAGVQALPEGTLLLYLDSRNHQEAVARVAAGGRLVAAFIEHRHLRVAEGDPAHWLRAVVAEDGARRNHASCLWAALPGGAGRYHLFPESCAVALPSGKRSAATSIDVADTDSDSGSGSDAGSSYRSQASSAAHRVRTAVRHGGGTGSGSVLAHVYGGGSGGGSGVISGSGSGSGASSVASSAADAWLASGPIPGISAGMGLLPPGMSLPALLASHMYYAALSGGFGGAGPQQLQQLQQQQGGPPGVAMGFGPGWGPFAPAAAAPVAKGDGEALGEGDGAGK